jgi:hypothetical protein
MDPSTKPLLAPFDEATQELLLEIDQAMKAQAEHIKGEANWASLNNKPYKPDMETLVWLKVMKGYGVLMNRALEAGWIKGALYEDAK